MILNRSNFNSIKFILKDASYTFFFKLLGVIVGLIINLYVAKFHGASVVGILATITTLYTFGLLISHAGFSTLFLRLIPELKEKGIENDTSIGLSYLIIGFLSLVVSMLLFYFEQNITDYFSFTHDDNLIANSSWFFFFYSIYSINVIYFRSNEEVKLFSFYQFFQPFLFFVLILTIDNIYGYVENSVIYALFLSYVILFVLTSFSVGLVNYRFSTDRNSYSFRELLSLSLPMFLTSSMWVVISQTDILMLSAMLSSHEVGVYSIVVKIGMFVSFILTSVNMVLAPKISALYFRGEIKELKNMMNKISRIIFLMTLPCVIMILIFGEYILAFFGSDFSQGYYTLVVLSLGQLIGCACGSVGHFLNMTGNQKAFNKIMCCAALINLTLNLILIPKFGILGAAFASFLCILFWNLASTYLINLRFKFRVGCF